jgi:hypothetical protein
MLNSASGHSLSIPKKEIKEKINVGERTFYIFKVLNAQVSRHNFSIYVLNQCPGALFNIFQINI